MFNQFAAAKAVYDAADALGATFTTDLGKYNTAVKDYNTALEETPDEASQDDIPARPSAPSAAGAYYGVSFNNAHTPVWTDTSILDGSGKAVATRSQIKAADDWKDSQRSGIIYLWSTTSGHDKTATYSASAYPAGHTYGRLGNTYDATHEAHRLKTGATPTAYINHMNVSIFPADTTMTTLAAGTSINITASPAALGTFAAPSPSAAPSGTFEEIDGASALAASVVGLATLTYTLF